LEVLLLIALLVVLLPLSGFLYQTAGSARDRRKFPPPGRLVDIGGRRWHLVEAGQGSPAVIFESGIAASSLNWTFLHAEIARFTRVCAYDRAWLGWSDPAATPRVALHLVEELRSLLAAASVPAPYILVGHSFGGLLVQSYAAAYPDQVAGLVLIDPLSAAEWAGVTGQRLRILRWGIRLSRRGALVARLGVVRLSLALLSGGARKIPKLIARVSSGRAESTLSRLVGEVQKMPPQVWPMVQAHWCQPKAFLGMAEYFKSLPASAEQAAELSELPQIPLSILSAANSTPAQLAGRDSIASRSPQSKHIMVPESGHWIHLDQPQVVLETILEMVDLVRSRLRCD
jgi:pimeloyl-ACP methyl ester carboxylesterase